MTRFRGQKLGDDPLFPFGDVDVPRLPVEDVGLGIGVKGECGSGTEGNVGKFCKDSKKRSDEDGRILKRGLSPLPSILSTKGPHPQGALLLFEDTWPSVLHPPGRER